MYNSKQAIIIFFTILIIGYSGWYFVNSSNSVNTGGVDLISTIDSIMTDVTVQQFNEKGHLINYLHTPEAQHIPLADTYLLFKPYVEFTQSLENSYKIMSNYAKSVHHGSQITFSDHVTIHYNGSGNNQLQTNTITTEELIYFPLKKLAISNVAVNLDQPGVHINSQGMKAYLDKKQIELLSKVQAIYQPKI